MNYIVSYTIKKNSSKVPAGKFTRKFKTKYGAQNFITELLYSKKRNWYKYVTNVRYITFALRK